MLAALAVRYGLQPMVLPGDGLLVRVVRWAWGQTILVAVSLFFFIAWMLRYWRPCVATTRGAVEPGDARTVASTTSKGRAETIGLALAMAAAAGLALLLRGRVAESYTVLSASMLPTFEPGDRVLGTRLAYRHGTTPRRGDLVVFRAGAIDGGVPNAPEFLVKRAIGLPGDHIEMRIGAAVINGWQVPACDVGPYLYVLPDGQGGAVFARVLVEYLEDDAYLTVHSPPRTPPADFAYDVKPGEVFVLGDNRNNSIDSRAYDHGRGGGVPLSGIEARVQWFLLGTHRDGQVDTTRFGRTVRALATSLHLEAVDDTALEQGIARCLKNWPKETHPPAAPTAALEPGTHRETGPGGAP